MFGDQTFYRRFCHLVWCCLILFDKVWRLSNIQSKTLNISFVLVFDGRCVVCLDSCVSNMFDAGMRTTLAQRLVSIVWSVFLVWSGLNVSFVRSIDQCFFVWLIVCGTLFVCLLRKKRATVTTYLYFPLCRKRLTWPEAHLMLCQCGRRQTSERKLVFSNFFPRNFRYLIRLVYKKYV